MIPFNKPYLTGNETRYIEEAVSSGKIAGDGIFTARCHEFFESRYGFKKCLLTTSCTDALEMAAILLDIREGDEVIMPSFTFVSTANAFVLRGARIVFADCSPDNPNIDVSGIEALITPRTRAIVVVHYAGISCQMDLVMELAEKYNLLVVEDAAQSIDSYFEHQPLGGIGHLSTFSFHETKNVISGEGGMLVINDDRFVERAEIIREKGTNRSKFFRGEIDKYGWVDIGSSYLPSDVTAAFLFAQLESLERIQERRLTLWHAYLERLNFLAEKGRIRLPFMPEFATNNAHMFYVLCSDQSDRQGLIDHLKQTDIHAVFHYLSLHKSQYYREKHDGRELPLCDYYADTLLRLPLFYELTIDDVDKIVDGIIGYCLK